ncbi:MAG: hypothetical protein ACK56F_21800, partial [bacterium]
TKENVALRAHVLDFLHVLQSSSSTLANDNRRSVTLSMSPAVLSTASHTRAMSSRDTRRSAPAHGGIASPRADNRSSSTVSGASSRTVRMGSGRNDRSSAVSFSSRCCTCPDRVSAIASVLDTHRSHTMTRPSSSRATISARSRA